MALPGNYEWVKKFEGSIETEFECRYTTTNRPQHEFEYTLSTFDIETMVAQLRLEDSGSYDETFIRVKSKEHAELIICAIEAPELLRYKKKEA